MVLENYRPGRGGTAGRGLGDALRRSTRGSIYASVSGFGQTGPYAQRPGYDLIAQGLSGVMSVTGEPGGDPVKCGIPIGDLSAGLFCAVAILSAVHARERTGRGQRIDTSLFEGALALSIWETAELWATGPRARAVRLRAPADRALPGAADPRRARHGRRQQPAAVGAPVRGDRPRQSWSTTRGSRQTTSGWRNRTELVAELEAATTARDSHDWVTALSEAGVPCGPIHDYRQVFEDPHTQAREMEVRLEHPVEGTISALGIPVKLSDTPGSIRRPAPLLGEHTAEVLREAGLSDAEIAAL